MKYALNILYISYHNSHVVYFSLIMQIQFDLKAEIRCF